MLTELGLIERVRRRVLDVPTPDGVRYADVYYQDAISRAVEWLNVVFCVEPPLEYVPDTMPSGLEEIARPFAYLVEVKATLEMARIRGAEATDREDANGTETETVEVPNLTVTKKRVGYSGPAFWMRLSKELLDELNDLVRRLERVGDHAVRRTSPLTDTVVRHALDSPLRLPSVTLGYDPIIGAVVLSWEALRDVRFASVVVERAPSASMTDAVKVAQSSDPHRTRFEDSGADPGTWYYRVTWRSTSGLVTRSGALPVEV